MHVDELFAIPQASRDVAQWRFEILRPHLEGRRPLRVVASEASIPYRTAVRWASGYRKSRLAALARKSSTDQGERRLASAQLIQAIEGLALERPPLPNSSWSSPSMNGLGLLATLATLSLFAIASGQNPENKMEASPTASPIGQCLSVSMSSPSKGMSIAQAVLSRKDAPPEAQIPALDCMAHAEVIVGKVEAASADEERALRILNSSPLPEAFRANILSNAGGVFTALGDSSRAIELFEAASTSAKQHNIPMAQVAALMNLASLYSETLNEPATADAYFRQAIQLAKPLHRDDVYMYFNYGFNLVQLKKYVEADSIFTHVIDLSLNDPSLEGVRYRAESQRAVILLAKGELSQALGLLHNAIPELRRLADVEGEARALLTFADLQLSKGNNQEALLSAQRVLRLTEHGPFPKGRIEAMHRLVRIYLAMNFPRKALEFSESLRELELGDLKQRNYRDIPTLEAKLHNQVDEYENSSATEST